ncbi:META domain-containing protein [Aliiglaciecola lipolytica]|uniref:DUF306 domain-containing protein n=1 Tax=Aliiglaciecola lipolytica E3 TaxID=1127673 RepID=K6YRT2_9ALTE|nr:META domain-containing protein [Aliiglaciecola lipolytica]GAC14025.1 hypothetical protein GLIP_1384 [Aliiglaciecola lipolytica E3]
MSTTRFLFVMMCLCSLASCSNEAAIDTPFADDTSANSPLVTTYWKLQTLNEQTVTMSASQARGQHLIFKSKDNQLVGFGGCNRFFGSFELNNESENSGTLSVSQLGATKMACPDSDINEQAFLNALSNTHRYSINGETLRLFDTQDIELARFSAVYL